MLKQVTKENEEKQNTLFLTQKSFQVTKICETEQMEKYFLLLSRKSQLFTPSLELLQRFFSFLFKLR